MPRQLRHIEIPNDAVERQEKLVFRQEDLRSLRRIFDKFPTDGEFADLFATLKGILDNEEQRLEEVDRSGDLVNHRSPLASRPQLSETTLADIGMRHIHGQMMASAVAKKLTFITTLIVALQTYRGSADYILPLVLANVVAWALSFTRKPTYAILREITDLNAEIRAVVEPILAGNVNAYADAADAMKELESLLLRYTVSAEQQIVKTLLDQKGLLSSLSRQKTAEGQAAITSAQPFQTLKITLEDRIQELRTQQSQLTATIEAIRGKLEAIYAQHVNQDHADPLVDMPENSALAQQNTIEEIRAILESLAPESEAAEAGALNRRHTTISTGQQTSPPAMESE